MNILPICRQTDIVVQELENEVLIYDLTNNKALCLNRTSALVYELADGTRTISEISNLMSERLKMLVSEEVVWLALDQLKKDNLLENNEMTEINFGGLSRRDIIRKVGFTSLVMLPVISSVLAPTAAMAASGGLAACASCTTNSECANNRCLNNRCSNGTANSLPPNTSQGTPWGETFVSCQPYATNCCSGNVDWYVTGNCYCQ